MVRTGLALPWAGEHAAVGDAQGGLSVFMRDGDAVLHTYSDYGAIIGLTCGTDLYLSLTPFGRQDASLLRHDGYDGRLG